MIDLTRYRNLLLVGGVLALLLGLLDGGLFVVFGNTHHALLSAEEPLPWDCLEKADRRVAALVQARSQGSSKLDESLGIYVGMSSALYDVDPVLLGTCEGSACRYVGLTGFMGSMTYLEVVTRSLLGSNLRPKRVLLLVHPSFLLGRSFEPPEAYGEALSAVRAGHWREALRAIKSWSWLKVNRYYLNHFARAMLYNGRLAVFGTLKLSFSAFAVPDPNPWQLGETERLEGRASAAETLQLVSHFCQLGWFDPQQYEMRQESRMRVLLELIDRLRARGSQVIVILMPEESAVRQRVPLTATRFLIDTLECHQPNPVIVLDLRASVPDELFHDASHLNTDGRRFFTQLLGQRLRERN